MPLQRIVLEPAIIEYSYKKIAEKVAAWKALNERVVVTIGSWDMLHIGHVRYLMKASGFGDRLVVGVDSDSCIRAYKGKNRPIIPQVERMEMVSYIWCVTIVTLVTDVDDRGQWQYGLLKKLRPDVFIAVEDSYPEEQRSHIREFTDNLIVLPRQAENTSSTDIFRKVVKAKTNRHPMLRRR